MIQIYAPFRLTNRVFRLYCWVERPGPVTNYSYLKMLKVMGYIFIKQK